MQSSPVAAYLQRFAEPGSAELAEAIGRDYQHILVIPAYAEPPDFLHQVLASIDRELVLTIVVANMPTNAPEAQRAQTQALLDHCREQDNVLAIDRVCKPLPPKQGVGLARKLGSDIATHLIAKGKIRSPWIYQTDADARLPSTYFDPLNQTDGALVFAHHHVSDNATLRQAARLYETHMAWYWQNLAALGSRYAYPSLGSAMAVHHESYSAVRGFPKRDAGEDFYLLNKIAKVAGVGVDLSRTITVQARMSSRVPFGTGPALAQICALLEQDPSGALYRSYHPDAFALLGGALATLRALAAGEEPPADRAAELLHELGLAKVLGNILRQYSQPTQRQRALEDWFDGLKTLRFMHLARRHFPDISILDCARHNPLIGPIVNPPADPA
ncbi:MAG: hypothetical protein AAF513_04005 [Pseudomonadota bacterium]